MILQCQIQYLESYKLKSFYAVDDAKANIKEYTNEECGWEIGDCVHLTGLVDKYLDCPLDTSKIGDSTCNGGDFLTPECSFEEYSYCALGTCIYVHIY